MIGLKTFLLFLLFLLFNFPFHVQAHEGLWIDEESGQPVENLYYTAFCTLGLGDRTFTGEATSMDSQEAVQVACRKGRLLCRQYARKNFLSPKGCKIKGVAMIH